MGTVKMQSKTKKLKYIFISHLKVVKLKLYLSDILELI